MASSKHKKNNNIQDDRRKITLIPGDGVGPEIVDVTRQLVDTLGVPIEWDIQEAGTGAMEKYGTPLLDSVFESIKRNRVALKGPVTTPVGTGFRSINVALRRKLDLYACLRPYKTYPGVRSKYEDVDLVIIRENTEDLYAGIEFKKDQEETLELIDWLGKHGARVRKDSGISIKPISVTATVRIVNFAFEYARQHGRRKVTAVHKANIMKYSDGLFLEVFRDIAKEYSDIESEDRIVDNMCMQLIQKPELYDVLVLPNLYGDILSDLCAGLVGGLGVAPGANIGTDIAVFEATHGSAPKYAGKNRVNPTAMILSAKMMLEYIGENKAAERLERAVAGVIREGKSVTYDFKPTPDNSTTVGTIEMGNAIREKL
jgi:isocitrate dehydrogenase (NAD+)